MYKLISNVLARQLSKALGKVIGESQNAFVKGRQILDVVMAANEIVDELISNKRVGVLCKLDMEKAFNNVD